MNDDDDRWAEALIKLLIEREQLLVAKRTAVAAIAERVAAYFGRTRVPTAAGLARELVDHAGVEDLLADDEELEAALAISKPTGPAPRTPIPPPPAPVAPEPIPSKNFAEDARALLAATQNRADAEHHELVTPWHLLRELLSQPAIHAMAKRRGGSPEAVQAPFQSVGQSGKPATISHELLALIKKAEELAPSQVRVTDLILAALESEHPGSLRAFRPPAPPPVPDEADDDDADEEEDDAEEPTSRSEGLLVVSAEFERAFRRAAAIARSSGDSWARAKSLHSRLPADLIADAEDEIDSTFPDDLLAAAAAAIPQFSRIGVALEMPHGEPSKPSEVAESILEVAGDADVSDDLIAVMDLRDRAATAYACIRRGVTWAKRNRQPIFVVEVGADAPEEYSSFGALLLALLSDAFPDTKDDGAAPPKFIPRLISS